MRILKSGEALGAEMPVRGAVLDEEELELVNRQAKKTLTAAEVYVFAVKLCDNEIDRDGERFPKGSLEELAELFVGRSGVFDHDWSAKAQCARIYKTELVVGEEKNSLGEPYWFVKGYAYMLRSEKNQALMEEIEGGIKREVSVSCATERKLCSVCGGDVRACGHEVGKWYDGTLCYGELVGIRDAYEWSFVAVPAQVQAGVLKGKAKGEICMDLKSFVEKQPDLTAEFETLCREAALGRRYVAELRAEVVRLGGLALPELDGATRKAMVLRAEAEELVAMKAAYEKQVERRLPVRVQLPVGGEVRRSGDEVFVI